MPLLCKEQWNNDTVFCLFKLNNKTSLKVLTLQCEDVILCGRQKRERKATQKKVKKLNKVIDFESAK
jgi:hypothetical protein